MNIDITTIQPYVTLIKDVLTGFTALTAAIIGIIGLQTWKKQLTANAEHQLARRVLVAVYKVRDAVENCRLFAWEGDSEILDVTKNIHDSTFDKLEAAQANLNVELLEAEAVWGAEVEYQRCIVLLQSLIQTMKGAYSTYYIKHRPTAVVGDTQEAYAILFIKSTYPKDEFSIEIDKTISGVENFLRPKLTLKQTKKKDPMWHRVRIRRKA